MNKVKSPWLYAILLTSLVTTGCNELSLDFNDKPKDDVEEPTPEPEPTPDPEPTPEPEPEPTAPQAASLDILPEMAKTLSFVWSDVQGASSYRVLENPDGISGFTQVGDDIAPGVEFLSIKDVPLIDRINAEYIIESCNDVGCTASDTVYVDASLENAIGYFKAESPISGYYFGRVITISGSGNALAVGLPDDESIATGINGNSADRSGRDIGSVHVFRNINGDWVFDGYIKASMVSDYDEFGDSIALSDDGNTLAISAIGESSATNDPADNSALDAGAAYVFERSESGWTQSQFLKASTPKAGTFFGTAIGVSSDGTYIAVGASQDSSNASGINGNEADNSMSNAGSVTIFKKDAGVWAKHAYLKASDPDANDFFGNGLSISDDGSVLAVSAPQWAHPGNAISGAGGVYIFKRSVDTWSQEQIVRASNPDINDRFGMDLALSGDGMTLVVGMPADKSFASGIDGNEADDTGYSIGSAFVFTDTGSGWAQDAYLKSVVPDNYNQFGESVDITADGSMIVVGERGDDGYSTGFGYNGVDTGKENSGAAHIFKKISGNWVAHMVLKASNAATGDNFGKDVSISSGGESIIVGADSEDGDSPLINGDIHNNDEVGSGAVYLF